MSQATETAARNLWMLRRVPATRSAGGSIAMGRITCFRIDPNGLEFPHEEDVPDALGDDGYVASQAFGRSGVQAGR